MSVPKYMKIRDAVLSDIRSGRLKKGDKLPKREELIEKYSVTRTTIDKALSELVKTGVLNSTPRLGTFVAIPVSAKRIAVVSRFAGTLPKEATIVGQSDLQQLFRTIISNSNDFKLKFIDIADALKNKRFHVDFDAVAWIHPGAGEELDMIRTIHHKTIITNRYYDGVNFVSTNHREAIRLMTEHYIKKCPADAQLFYLGWESGDFVSNERKEGFVEACANANRFYRFCSMLPGDMEKNYQSLMTLPINPELPVIMVAGSCNMTGAVFRMASSRKLKLWKNLFYCDFDNVDSLERTGVRVTSAIQDYHTMGLELVDALKRLGEKPIQKFIPYKIVGIKG